MCEITSTIMPAEQAEQTAGPPHHTVSDFTAERHARPKCSAEEEDSFVPVVDVFTLQALTLRPHNAMIRVAEWCAAQRAEHRPELPPYHTQQQQVQVLPPSYDASMTAIAGAASFTTVPPLLYNALPTATQTHDRAPVQTEPAGGQAQCVTTCSRTNDNGKSSADDPVAAVAKDSGNNKLQLNKSNKKGQASLLVVAAEEQDKVHTGPTVAAVEALHVRVDTEVETEKDDSTTQRLPQTRKPRKSARPVRRKNEEGGGSASAAAQLQTLHARLMLSVDSQRRTSHATSPHRAEGHEGAYNTVSHNAPDNNYESNNNKSNGEAMTEPKSAPLHACYYHEHTQPTPPTSTNQASPYSYDAVNVNHSPAYAASGEVSHTMTENATITTGRQERPLAMSALSLPHSCSSAVAEDAVSAGVNNTKKRATLLHPMKELQVCISNGSGLCAQTLHTQQQQQSSNDTRDTMSTTPLGLVATFSDFRARVLHRWPANTSLQAKYNHQEGNGAANNGILDTASNRNDTTHVPAPFSHASMQGSHGLTGVGPTFAEVEALYSGTQSCTSGVVNSRRGSITSSHTLHAPLSRPQSPSYSEQTSLRPMSTTTEMESGTGRSNGVPPIVVSVGEKDHPLSRPMSYGAGNHTSSTSASMPMYYQQQNNVAHGNTHGNGIMIGHGNGNGVVVNFSTTMRNGSGPANVGPATTKANTVLNDLRVSQPWVLVATDWLGGKENEVNEEEEAEAEQRETTLPSRNNDAPFTQRDEASDAGLPEAQKDDMTQTRKLLQKHVHQLLTSQLYELLQGWNLLTSHVTATHMTCEANNNNNNDDVKESVATSNPNEVDVRVGNNMSSNALHPRVLSASAAPFVPMTIDHTTSDTPAQSTRASPCMMSMTSTATTLTAMACDTTQPHTSNEAQTTAATLHERTINGNTNNLNHHRSNEENTIGKQVPLCAYRSMGVYPYGLAYAVTRAGTAHASFPSSSSSSTDEAVECNGKTPVMQADAQHNEDTTGNAAHLPSHDSALHVTQPYFSPLMTPSATAVASPDAIAANGAPTALNTNTISGTHNHATNAIESNHKTDGDEQIEYFRAKACIQIHITQSLAINVQEENSNVVDDEKTRFFARAARLARDLQQFTSTGSMSPAALKAQLNDALMALLTRTPCFATCLRPSHNNNDVDDLDDEAAECMTSCATSSVSLRAVRWPGGRLMSSALLTRAAQPWRVKVSGPFPSPSQSTTHRTSQPHRTINNNSTAADQPPSYITPLALHLTTHVLPRAHNDAGNNEKEQTQDVRLCVTVLARRTLQGSANDRKNKEEVQPVAMREAAFAALTTLFPAAFILSAHTTQIAFSHCVVHDGMVHMQPFQSLPLPVVRHVQPHIVKDKYVATVANVLNETKTEAKSVQVATQQQQVAEPRASVTSKDTGNPALTLAKDTVQDESEQSTQPVSVEVTPNTSASPVCTTNTTVAVPVEAVEEPVRTTQSVTMWTASVSDEVHKAIEAWLRLLTQWSTLQTTLKDTTTTTQLLAQLMQEGSNVTTQSSAGKRRTVGGNTRISTVQSGIVTEVLEGYVQLVRDQLLTLTFNVSDDQKAETSDNTNESCGAPVTTLAKCATMPELTRWLQQYLVQPVQAFEDSLRKAHILQETPLTIAASMGSTINSAKHSRRASVIGAQLAVGKGTSKSNAAGSGTRTGDKTSVKGSASDVTLSVVALPALRVLLRIVHQLPAKAKAGKRETTSAAVVYLSAEAVEALWQEAMHDAAKYNVDFSPREASKLTHARDALVLRVQNSTALLERRAEQLRLLHATVWPQCLLSFAQEHARLVQDCIRGYDALRVQCDRSSSVLLARTERTVVQGSAKGTRQSDKRKGSTATTTTMSAGEDTEAKDAEAQVSHNVEQQTKTTTPTNNNNNNKGTTSRTTSIGGETQATTSNTPRAETHSTELELTQHSMLLMMSSSTITTNTATTAPAVMPEATEADTTITNANPSHVQGGTKEKAARTSLPVTGTHSRSSTTTTSCIVPTGTLHVNSPRKTPDESSTTTTTTTTTDTITAHHKKTASVATTATISSRSGAEAAAVVVVVKKPLSLRGSTHQSTNSAERRGNAAAYHASSLSSGSMTNITNSSNRRTRNEGKSDEPSAPASRTNNNTQSNSASANRSAPRRAQDNKSPSSIRKSDNTVVSGSSVVKSGVSMPRLGEHRFVMQDRAMAKISIIFVLCGACILVALFYL